MNLIEKLGGYERAKAIANCKSGVVHPTKQLLDALLEHRRANNIFELGDKVVYLGGAGLNGLFEIESLTKTGKPKTVRTKRFGNFPCRHLTVRHATDEEIKADRKL